MAVAIAWTQRDLPAQLPQPAVVVILPPDAEGRESVVAPKTVLDQLVVTPRSPGVVLSSSSYAMTADSVGARVVATYIVNALDDGPAVATLPLADARLEKVTVNKAAAFPIAPRPGSYAIPFLERAGTRSKSCSRSRTRGLTPIESCRFGVPECPVTRLKADLPGEARQAQVVGRIGRLTMTGGERVRLEVDMGAVKSLHIRWREGAGGQATVKVREGCIWDVSEAGAELTASYLARVDRGTISSLQFEVPAELDVLGVTTRSLDPTGVAAMREWTLGKKRPAFAPCASTSRGRPPVGCWWSSPARRVSRSPTSQYCTSQADRAAA